MDKIYDLIIIGSGPAGMTAAIYARRSGLKVLVIEASAPGGKLIKTYHIENYPGVMSMGGADLAYKMYEQMESFEAETDFDEVKEVKDLGQLKEVVTANNSYKTKAIIVATGTKERLLNIDGEAKFTGKGVSYCAVCDGFFFKNKDVAVIGGGNSALEEALYLTQFVNKLYVIIRRDVFRADAIIVDKVLNNPKIEVIRSSIPLSIEGEDKVESLILENVLDKSQRRLKLDGIFPYIGAEPCTSFLKDLDILDDKGYIVVNDKMETKLKGIYGAGDCNVKNLRQVVTACSDGAIAAQNAYHYIESLN